jgi:hypothetical protein
VERQALDHESLLGSPVTRYTPATSQPGVLPGVLPVRDSCVPLVAFKLQGGAGAWWHRHQEERRLKGEPRVNRWPQMIALLKARFPPAEHEQMLFIQFQNCTKVSSLPIQGTTADHSGLVFFSKLNSTAWRFLLNWT